MRSSLRMIPLLLVPLLVGCAGGTDDDALVVQTDDSAAPDAAENIADVRRELEQTNSRFAALMNQGDVAGFGGVYTDDAVIYPPDMEATSGREGITQFWQGGHEQLGIRDLRLDTEEVEVMGDAAWEAGTASFETNQGPVSAKYIVIWKRTPDGWRWHRDIWNMNPPRDG